MTVKGKINIVRWSYLKRKATGKTYKEMQTKKANYRINLENLNIMILVC